MLRVIIQSPHYVSVCLARSKLGAKEASPVNGLRGRHKCLHVNIRQPEAVIVAKKASQKSLDKWTKQKWRTKSGKPSTQGKKATGERYLPSAAIKSMSSSEYAATTRKKRADTKKGKQHSSQPKKIAKKTRRFRKK